MNREQATCKISRTKDLRLVKVTYSSLLSHGSGALRQVAITWRWNARTKALRLSVGGYGNVPPPAGQWRLWPSVTRYPGTAYYLHWFNVSLSYLPNATTIF
jgi:hypothetical protein